MIHCGPEVWCSPRMLSAFKCHFSSDNLNTETWIHSPFLAEEGINGKELSKNDLIHLRRNSMLGQFNTEFIKRISCLPLTGAYDCEGRSATKVQILFSVTWTRDFASVLPLKLQSEMIGFQKKLDQGHLRNINKNFKLYANQRISSILG